MEDAERRDRSSTPVFMRRPAYSACGALSARFVHGDRETVTNLGQVLPAPEQLAIDYKCRDSKNAERLRCAADAVDFPPPLPRRIGRETCRVGARFREHGPDDGGILDVELALPEAFKCQIMVAAQHRVSLPLRVEHAARGDGRVPDLLRSADDETAFV